MTQFNRCFSLLVAITLSLLVFLVLFPDIPTDASHEDSIVIRLIQSMRSTWKTINNLEPTQKANITILFWSQYHKQDIWWRYMMTDGQGKVCPASSCFFTYDKSSLNVSDALLFDLAANTSVKPAIHHPHQYWILYNHEWLDYLHPTSVEDDTFNLTASYRSDSDIPILYGECFPRSKPYELTKGVLKLKKGLALWYVSHCETNSLREEYVKSLQKFIDIDVSGHCPHLNTVNIKQPGEPQRVGKDLSGKYLTDINSYKFYIAYENTFCRDYITEKVFKILEDGVFTIPIVRGAGPYENYLPRGSYINSGDFVSPQELSRYIKRLDNNDTLFMKYFAYRSNTICHNYAATKHHWPCAICDGVAKAKSSQVQQTHSRETLQKMFSPNGNCEYRRF